MTATMTARALVNTLENLNIPTSSPNAAGVYMNQNLPSIAEAKELIKTVSGGHSCSERGKDKKYVPYVSAYLVMNALKEAVKNEALNMFALLKESKADADNLLASDKKWMFAEPETKKPAIDIETADEATIESIKAGNEKKGARKALAIKVFNEQIKPSMEFDKATERFVFPEESRKGARKAAIATLMEHVGLSENGASTYFANFCTMKWA